MVNDNLFKKIINNKFLNRTIFSKVNLINLQETNYTYKWNELINNPVLLSKYNYNDFVLEYFSKAENNCFYYSHLFRKIDLVLHSYIILDRVDLIEKFINHLSSLYNDFDEFNKYGPNLSVLSYAVTKGSPNVIDFLMRRINFQNKKIDEYSTLTLEEILIDFKFIDGIFKSNNSVDLIEFIVSNFDKVSQPIYVEIALKAVVKDRLDLLLWVIKSNRQCSTFIYNQESIVTVLDVLKQLYSIYSSKKEVCQSKQDDENDFYFHLFNSFQSIYSFLLDKGRFDIIHWSIDTGITRAPDTINIRSGDINLDQIKYFQLKGINLNFRDAPLNTLKLFHQEGIGIGYKWPENFLLDAKNRFDVLKWHLENRTEVSVGVLLDYAAANNHMEIVKWLHEVRSERCTTNAMNYAAGNGHLDVVKWLHNNRTEGCTRYAIDIASLNQHLNVVEWLNENRTEGYSMSAFTSAFTRESLKMAFWFCQTRKEGYHDGLALAIKKGNIEMVRWFIEVGKVDPSKLSNILLTKAVDCPANIDLIKLVFPLLNSETARTLAKQINEDESGSILFSLFERACSVGDSVDIFKFLHSHGFYFEDHDDIIRIFLRALHFERYSIVEFIDQYYKIPTIDIENYLFIFNYDEFEIYRPDFFYNIEIYRYFIDTRKDLFINNQHLYTLIWNLRFNVASWLLENHQNSFDILSLSHYLCLEYNLFKDHSLLDLKDIILNLKKLHFYHQSKNIFIKF